MKKAILKTNKLCKTFSTGEMQQDVLKNMDVEIYEGDFTVIPYSCAKLSAQTAFLLK